MNREDITRHELDYTNKSENKIASLLILLAWVILIIGFIVPFIPQADDTRPPFFATAGGFVMLAAFFRGIAEIIKLLHNINHKLRD